MVHQVGSMVAIGGGYTFRGNKAAGVVVAKGDILVKDTATTPDSYKVAAAGAAIPGPFYIATQSATSAETGVSLASGGLWNVTGGDTIEPGDDVMLSTTVAGQCVKSTAVTTVALLQGKVGVSMGNSDTFGTSLTTASTVGQQFVLNMDKGY